MSRDTQSKFLAALTQIAEENGYEVIDDRRYSNTGTISIEKPDSFSSVVEFYYSFQTGYATFQELKPAFGMPHLAGKQMPYVLSGELSERMLDPIAAILKKA